jgi:hypothetical protein
VQSPAFEANMLARRFRVPAVDESKHAGASLVALVQVLQAFEGEPEAEGGKENG